MANWQLSNVVEFGLFSEPFPQQAAIVVMNTKCSLTSNPACFAACNTLFKEGDPPRNFCWILTDISVLACCLLGDGNRLALNKSFNGDASMCSTDVKRGEENGEGGRDGWVETGKSGRRQRRQPTLFSRGDKGVLQHFLKFTTGNIFIASYVCINMVSIMKEKRRILSIFCATSENQVPKI